MVGGSYVNEKPKLVCYTIYKRYTATGTGAILLYKNANACIIL